MGRDPGLRPRTPPSLRPLWLHSRPTGSPPRPTPRWRQQRTRQPRTALRQMPRQLYGTQRTSGVVSPLPPASTGPIALIAPNVQSVVPDADAEARVMSTKHVRERASAKTTSQRTGRPGRFEFTPLLVILVQNGNNRKLVTGTAVPRLSTESHSSECLRRNPRTALSKNAVRYSPS